MSDAILLHGGRAERAQWPSLLAALQNATQDETDQKLRYHLEFVIEEWFDNLCTHARELKHDIVQYSVQLMRLDADQGWELVLTDDGLAFDPTQQAPSDHNAPLEERPIGQLGIQLSLQMAQLTPNYQRLGQNNVLRLGFQSRPD